MYPAGQAGMALYTYRLANTLADKGLHVSLFVDEQYELDLLPVKFNKIKVLSTRNVSVGSSQHAIVRRANIIGAHLYNWHKFCGYVRKDKPEIVHIQILFHLIDWHILNQLKRTNARLVVTVHDVIPHKFYARRFGWLELFILQYIYNKADRLIVHAETNKQQLLENFSVREDKVIVIPHGEYSLRGISREISDDQARAKLEVNINQKVILFFGFIRKTKGIDILLEAFDKVAEEFPDIILIVAGLPIQGESFSEHRRFINEMKHGGKVKCFVEYVEYADIPCFFRVADIVVLPYLEFYSQSGVVHLAQGFGKAVIASDVGGLPEAVENQKSGLIVPAGDVERLAEAMSYLLENESVRIRMGERAMEMAMERFSWNSIAMATIEKAYS